MEIWVEKGRRVTHCRYSSSATVRQLYQNLGFQNDEYENYLITIKNEIIEGVVKLGDIDMS